jgi:calcium-binding protein CML
MSLYNRLSTAPFQEIKEMKTIMDKDRNGIIDFTEFEDMMAIKLVERDAKENLVKAFHIIDQYKYVNTFISIH